ncbi:hypothetical protein [Streptomyces hawaiiensis]|uniref:Uncharacterized protein n=1 Tax=Streptomyces hawaiiensis TaxID=67305 RepID=A0A6G5RJZ5_9ACTN|nr:hypothetical protein [Streptomyces hawaiiensis]QCD58478.1 hypothetical protein CEB94_29240 [Streptomyces hawaiiensis]
MTLAVDVFVRDANGEWRVLDVPQGCDDSAGFESWRRTVWGSETVRSLGARRLPVLAEDNLFVEADEVPGFLREVALLRANLDLIAATTERPRGITERRDQLGSRLRNIEATALRALESGAGVLIW